LLSVPASTVRGVESDDVVDPGDAAIQALLALTAENTHDEEKRERLMDYILTVPPLTEWPADCREKLWETCQFIKGLAEDLRQRKARDGGDAN
jgi:hypothetical protein